MQKIKLFISVVFVLVLFSCLTGCIKKETTENPNIVSLNTSPLFDIDVIKDKFYGYTGYMDSTDVFELIDNKFGEATAILIQGKDTEEYVNINCLVEGIMEDYTLKEIGAIINLDFSEDKLQYNYSKAALIEESSKFFIEDDALFISDIIKDYTDTIVGLKLSRSK